MSKSVLCCLGAGIAMISIVLAGGVWGATVPQNEPRITVGGSGLQSIKAGAVELLEEGPLRVNQETSQIIGAANPGYRAGR